MNSAQGTGTALPSEALVIYDGNCGFCKSMVSFASRHMQPGRAEFVASQDPKIQPVLEQHGLQQTASHTVIYLDSGQALLRSSAALKTMRLMKWPWPWIAAAGTIVPISLRDWAYNQIAKRRSCGANATSCSR